MLRISEGTIYGRGCDLVKAEQMVKKSLVIYERLGQLGGIANNYSNIGVVHQARGDDEKAREYWEKALGLCAKVGMKPEIEKTQRLIDGLKNK